MRVAADDDRLVMVGLPEERQQLGEYKHLRRPAVVLCVVAVLAAVMFAATAVLAVPVSGQSMEPTLGSGDRMVVLPAGGADVERFAVVIGRFSDTGPNIAKRVIGLPGDRVSIEKYGDRPGIVRVQPGGTGDWFVVDNPAWDQRWKQIAGNCCLPTGKAAPRPEEAQVPPGMLFVLGDNIGFSDDSRAHGWLPARLVSGRALFRIFPPGFLGGVTLRPADR